MSIERRPNGRYYYDFWCRGDRFRGPEDGANTRAAAYSSQETRRKEIKTAPARERAAAAAPLTIRAACNKFWNEVGTFYGGGKGTYRKTVYTALDWIAAAVGPQTLVRDIDTATLTMIIAARRGEGVRNGTVNRTVTELIRRIQLRSQKVWKQRDLPDIEWDKLMLPEPKERVRELRDHEHVSLVSTMRGDYWPAIAFCLACGARKEEAVRKDDDGGLRWSDVDWSARLITLRGKGRDGMKKERVIPLTDEIAAILSPLRGHHKVYVFTYIGKRTRANANTGKLTVAGQRYPMTYSGLSTAWRRHGAKKAGLKDFRFHDTRHTAATVLLRSSGNLKMVQQLLGHEEITTTGKYAHVHVEDLRAGMEKAARAKVPMRVPTRKVG